MRSLTRASLEGGGGSSLRPTSVSWAWSLSDIVAARAEPVRGAWRRGIEAGRLGRRGFSKEEKLFLFIWRDDDERVGLGGCDAFQVTLLAFLFNKSFFLLIFKFWHKKKAINYF